MFYIVYAVYCLWFIVTAGRKFDLENRILVRGVNDVNLFCKLVVYDFESSMGCEVY